MLRPKFSLLKKTTHGVHRRLKTSADGGMGQPKKDSRLNQNQSQSHVSAAHDIRHRLKTSTDKRPTEEDFPPHTRSTLTEDEHQTAPVKWPKGQSQNQISAARAEEEKILKRKSTRFGARIP